MLKLRPQEAAPDSGFLEARVKVLLSQLGIAHLTPTLRGRGPADADAPRLWFKGNTENALWGIRFEREGEKISRRSLYLLAGSMKGETAGFCLHVGAETPSSEHELLFELWSEDGESRGILAVSGCQTAEISNGEKVLPDLSNQARTSATLRLFAKLNCDLPQMLLQSRLVLPWGDPVELVEGEKCWCSSLETGEPARISGQMAPLTSAAPRIKVLVKELKMSEISNVNLTLEMGALEIPLQDFLRIRVGHTLECDMPEGTSGILRMDGRLLAAVTIGLEPEGLSIQIKELFSHSSATQLSPRSSDKAESTFSGVSL